MDGIRFENFPYRGKCLNCGKDYRGRGRKYCSIACYSTSKEAKARLQKMSGNGGKKGRKYPELYSLQHQIRVDGRRRPVLPSEETRRKISLANTGKKRTEQEKQLMSWKQWMRGKSMPPETRKRLSLATSGHRHWHWMGGIGSMPYSHQFQNHIRHEVRRRDKYSCQKCGIKDVHISVHHIDKNKLNDELTNLVCMCKSCHTQTHNESRRIVWQTHSAS